MSEQEKEETVELVPSRGCFANAGYVFGICMGIWSNGATLYNAKLLFDLGHFYFSGFTLFFLFLPGLVSSVAVLVLWWYGHKWLSPLPGWKIVPLAMGLLMFYPVVPIGLNIYTLFTYKKPHVASLARLFEGFLDDGPQFVLKLIVVVLYGIGTSAVKSEVIFTLSMITSFMSLVWNGLSFNERETSLCPTKFLLCMPMFAAFAGARAFTLAVFFKETLEENNGLGKAEWIGALIVTLVCLTVNITAFILCGQDHIRSVLFGLCSFLIPVGYNNDAYFYQMPRQSLLKSRRSHMKQEDKEEPYAQVTGDQGNNGDPMTEMGWVVPSSRPLSVTSAPPPPPRPPPPTIEPTSEPSPENKEDTSEPETRLRGGLLRPLRPLIDAIKPEESSEPPENKPIFGGLFNRSKSEEVKPPPPEKEVRGGLFLIIYTVSNLVMCYSCSAYIYVTRDDLSAEAVDALMIPQILAVVPGSLFALGRSLLLPDWKPPCCHRNVWAPFKVFMATLCGLLAYASLVPAVLWSTVYKLTSSAEVIFDD